MAREINESKQEEKKEKELCVCVNCGSPYLKEHDDHCGYLCSLCR